MPGLLRSIFVFRTDLLMYSRTFFSDLSAMRRFRGKRGFKKTSWNNLSCGFRSSPWVIAISRTTTTTTAVQYHDAHLVCKRRAKTHTHADSLYIAFMIPKSSIHKPNNFTHQLCDGKQGTSTLMSPYIPEINLMIFPCVRATDQTNQALYTCTAGLALA